MQWHYSCNRNLHCELHCEYVVLRWPLWLNTHGGSICYHLKSRHTQKHILPPLTHCSSSLSRRKPNMFHNISLQMWRLLTMLELVVIFTCSRRDVGDSNNYGLWLSSQDIRWVLLLLLSNFHRNLRLNNFSCNHRGGWGGGAPPPRTGFSFRTLSGKATKKNFRKVEFLVNSLSFFKDSLSFPKYYLSLSWNSLNFLLFYLYSCIVIRLILIEKE